MKQRFEWDEEEEKWLIAPLEVCLMWKGGLISQLQLSCWSLVAGGAHNQQSDNQRVWDGCCWPAQLDTGRRRSSENLIPKMRKCFRTTRVLLYTQGNLGYSEVTTEMNPLTDIPNSQHTCDEYLQQHEYVHIMKNLKNYSPVPIF